MAQPIAEIRENVPLAPLTTFGVGGEARFFAEVTSEARLTDALAWAAREGLRTFVLGGGSNLLVPDEGFDGLVVRVAVSGIEPLGNGCFDVGAGEVWDEFVRRAVTEGCAGVECMAGIPGSVGGTPVQNVGAYGQEVSETIVAVRALDRTTGTIVELGREECRFRYRASLFNTDEPGRYVVTHVRFQLRPGGDATLKYAELEKRVSEVATQPVTLAETAGIVREIRAGKGMLIVEGDADARSAGSFFKNPIVACEVAERVKEAAGREPPMWAASEGMVKLPAAWLLEQAGFVKGYGTGRVRISSKHTLALTNRDGATFADVMAMEREIVEGVERKFGVRLEREPVLMR